MGHQLILVQFHRRHHLGGLACAGNDADFYAGTGTVTVSGSQNVGNIIFDTGSSGYSLTGGTLNLSGGSITTNQNATIGSIFGGSVALTKSGSATLTLSGNNVQTGGLIVNGGLLAITTAQSYGGATTITAGLSRSVPASRSPRGSRTTWTPRILPT